MIRAGHEASQTPKRWERDAIVRFSHVDAAGIVFYPRYLEMLVSAMPELPIAQAPFALDFEFHRPNSLGDRLELTCEVEGDAWNIRGQTGTQKNFSASLRTLGEPALNGDEHAPALEAFCTPVTTLRSWMADSTGRLHMTRYYELVSATVEQWFERSLKLSFARLHSVDRNGVPTVRLSTRCNDLPLVDSDFHMWIRPTRVGTSSVGFTSWLVQGSTCLVQTRQIIVWIDGRGSEFRSLPLPAPLRASLIAQIASPLHT